MRLTIPRSRLTARPQLCKVATASSGLAPMQLTTALLGRHSKGSVEEGGTPKTAALQRSSEVLPLPGDPTTTPKRQDTGSPSIAPSHPRPPQRSAASCARVSAFLITVGRGAGAGCDMALWRVVPSGWSRHGTPIRRRVIKPLLSIWRFSVLGAKSNNNRQSGRALCHDPRVDNVPRSRAASARPRGRRRPHGFRGETWK